MKIKEKKRNKKGKNGEAYESKCEEGKTIKAKGNGDG